jgi:protein gp37
MATSSIEWTELTWNPTTGCDKVSAGCKFCYAEIMSRPRNFFSVKSSD